MGEKLLVLATPFALLAAGWVIFYVIKEPPPLDACREGRAPGVEAYRQGLGTYATVAAGGIAALIARISQTPRTLFALATCAWLTLLYHASNDAFEAHALGALAALFLGGELVMVLSAIATLVIPRPRLAPLIYLWTALLILIPAAAAWPAGEGVALLCLD